MWALLGRKAFLGYLGAGLLLSCASTAYARDREAAESFHMSKRGCLWGGGVKDMLTSFFVIAELAIWEVGSRFARHWLPRPSPEEGGGQPIDILDLLTVRFKHTRSLSNKIDTTIYRPPVQSVWIFVCNHEYCTPRIWTPS